MNKTTLEVNDEEMALVLALREEKRIEAYKIKLKEIRDNCNHKWEYEFSSDYVSYYKCSKCGQGKSLQFKNSR